MTRPAQPPTTPSFDPAAAFDPPTRSAVAAVGAAANGLSIDVYFVGGVPRDLLLRRPIGHDLDIVAVGDAIALAGRLAAAAGGAVVAHPRFGTATWRHGEISIDLVTARRESYDRPGALPIITPGTLDDDLARRDFTINTLAFAIDAGGFGPLIDRHGGRADVMDGVVRVLHPRSFVDDPTRIVRAVRAEARFGFRMDEPTAAAARAAAGGLATLSAARLRNELLRLFAEPAVASAIERLASLGALGAGGAFGAPSDPGDGGEGGDGWWTASNVERILRRLSEREQHQEQEQEQENVATSLPRLLAWLAAGGADGVRAGERLRLDRVAARDLATAASLAADRVLVDPRTPTSETNARIARGKPSPRALRIALAAAREDSARGRIDRYALDGSARPLPVDGHDLVALGVPPGARVGELLSRLRAAWWDEVVNSRDEALTYAARLADTDLEDNDRGADAADALGDAHGSATRGGPPAVL
ncbi:MAG: hypothetical protein ABI780_03655 [Ardenticatenales bacterium]